MWAAPTTWATWTPSCATLRFHLTPATWASAHGINPYGDAVSGFRMRMKSQDLGDCHLVMESVLQVDVQVWMCRHLAMQLLVMRQRQLTRTGRLYTCAWIRHPLHLRHHIQYRMRLMNAAHLFRGRDQHEIYLPGRPSPFPTHLPHRQVLRHACRAFMRSMRLLPKGGTK